MVTYLKKVSAFIAISLATMVISLATNAGAAVAPPITPVPTWVPVPGFGAVITKIAVDAAGAIYVADNSHKEIVKLDPSGNYQGKITTSTIGAPYGLAVLKNGNIVVTIQSPVPKIIMMDPAGTILSNGTQLGNAVLQKPSAVVVDSLDNIYVLDSGEMHGTTYTDGNGYRYLNNNYTSVHVFTKNGSKYLTTPYVGVRPAGYADNSFSQASRLSPYDSHAGGKGFGLLSPEGLAYDSVNQRILVADSGNSRVVAFGSAQSSTPFVQLTSGTNPLYWGEPIGSTQDGSNYHCGAPVSVAVENTASRLYVLDRSLNRIKVFDYSTGAFLKIIDPEDSGFQSISMFQPRDIIIYKGNILVTSEKTTQEANLATFSIASTTKWPPSSVQLTLDEYPQNIVKQSSDLFRFTGKVETGANVAWLNASVQGSCVIPNPIGSSMESFYCDIAMDTTNGVTGTMQSIVITATKSSSDVSVSASPWYTTGSTLLNPPVVVSNTPSSTFVKSASVTLTGTIDISATGAIEGSMVLLKNLSDSTLTYATIDLQAPGNAKPWSALVLLEEGVNTFNVTGWAKMTQSGFASQPTVKLDTVLPNINLSFFSDNDYTTRQVVNLNGIASDINLDKIAMSVNSVPVSSNLKFDPSTQYFSTAVSLMLNGANTVSVTATDKAGNSRTESRVVNLAPMIAVPLTVSTPADNIVISASEPFMSYAGTVDSTTTSLEIGIDFDSALTNPSLNWNTSSTRYKGSDLTLQTANVQAIGSYGQLNEIRSIYMDQSKPAAQITVPMTDISTNLSGNFNFSGSFDVSAAAPTSLISSITAALFDSDPSDDIANPLPVPSVTKNDGNKTFVGSVNTSGLPEGVYSLKVTVTNQAAASSIVTRNFIIDRTPPRLGICVDPASPDTLYGAVESGVTLADNALRPVTLTGNIWSISKTGLDMQAFIMTGTDSAGNTNQSTLPSSSNKYDGDMDGDGIVRVYDAVIALRAIANNPSPAQIAHGDVSVVGYTAGGLSCPDGSLTLEDVQMILVKASGQMWQ